MHHEPEDWIGFGQFVAKEDKYDVIDVGDVDREDLLGRQAARIGRLDKNGIAALALKSKPTAVLSTPALVNVNEALSSSPVPVNGPYVKLFPASGSVVLRLPTVVSEAWFSATLLPESVISD